MNAAPRPGLMEDVFGPVIYSYTRKQALEDGVLVDVSAMAREAGIKFPTAITTAVHALCTPPKGSHEDYKGRLWDCLWMLRMAIRRSEGDTIRYSVKIGRRIERLWAKCGPGDDMEPTITILVTGED